MYLECQFLIGTIVAAGNWWLVVEAVKPKGVCVIIIFKSLQGYAFFFDWGSCSAYYVVSVSYFLNNAGGGGML